MASSKLWVYIFSLSTIQLCFSASFTVVKEPSGSVFPLEGSKFTVKCIVTGVDELPNATFRDRNNKVVEGSTDGHRTFIKDIDGFNEVLTLIWNPLRLTDIEIPDLSCDVGDTDRFKYNIHIIPIVSKPMINLYPKNETVNKDDDLTLTCDIKVKMFEKWENFALEWLFNGQLIDKNSNKYEINKLVDETENKSSTLTVSKASNKDEGIYQCRANVNLKSGDTTDSTFSEDADIEVKWEDTSTPAKQEIIKMNEESVEMACLIKGYPIPKLHWQKGDDTLAADDDSRYTFSNDTKYGTENSLFAISKVIYTDRGKYYCVATFQSGKSSRQEFILRVRDPLGALWPALGILIEAILLFLIIGLYTCFKKSKHQNTDDVDGANNEKSPLVKDAPRVSYTTGDEGVKSRLVNDEKA